MWLYPAMSFWIRVSILLFYRRLFSTPGSRFKTVIHVLLVMQVVYLIVFSILPAFVGHPLHKLWDPLERNQHMNNYYYAYTHFALYATSMVFDAILLFLPTWPLWKCWLFPVVDLRLSVIADNTHCSANATSSTALNRRGFHDGVRVSACQVPPQRVSPNRLFRATVVAAWKLAINVIEFYRFTRIDPRCTSNTMRSFLEIPAPFTNSTNTSHRDHV